MNKIRTSRFVRYTQHFSYSSSRSHPALPKNISPRRTDDSVTVVAHLPLPRASVSQIFLQGRATSNHPAGFLGRLHDR
jgi:hypothetical protein